jgi:endogenous inhibitor of DNA gyrase (YacG/DUF329 family)
MIDLGTWAKEGYRVSEHGTLEKNDDEELMV